MSQFKISHYSLTFTEEQLPIPSRRRSRLFSVTPRSRVYSLISSEVSDGFLCNRLLFSYFIGIMRCDFIAEGVIKATKELQLDIPLVVRLKGTKELEAKQ